MSKNYLAKLESDEALLTAISEVNVHLLLYLYLVTIPILKMCYGSCITLLVEFSWF